MAKKAKKKSKNKKEAQLVIRLDGKVRDQFIDACQDLDTTASREMRRFIKRFLREYESGKYND